ncbi:hypothetical protein KHA80_19585 [Anaerobacillus sp. HL2]|nr:hypothetical protein KHA80_19585 [Anaerobacillus sp. HL2]
MVKTIEIIKRRRCFMLKGKVHLLQGASRELKKTVTLEIEKLEQATVQVKLCR